MEDDIFDPYDIDMQHFNPDLYLSKLLQDYSLSDLIERKDAVCKSIVSLDSEMKTLVYENYNKFISATDTIRKMKSDFCKMEDEMDLLAMNMAAITDFSGKISSTLQDRRQQITKLSNVHSLLKKLQFLFELPAKLNRFLNAGAYRQVVRTYLQAQQVLNQYQHMPSFQGIRQDCDVLIDQLKIKLNEEFRNQDATQKQLADVVNLLLQLNEPPVQLCDEVLNHASLKLNKDLTELEIQVKLQRGEFETSSEKPVDAYHYSPLDILAFVDLGCNEFLSDISLAIAAYRDMFLSPNHAVFVHNNSLNSSETYDAMTKKLESFVISFMERYLSLMKARVNEEKDTGDNSMLVRALDRFHRRLEAMSSLMPSPHFSSKGIEIVSSAAQSRCKYYLTRVKQHLNDCITDTRQTLAITRPSNTVEGGLNFSSLLHKMVKSIEDQIKTVLCNLQSFIQSDVTFALASGFREKFCKVYVREGFTVAFFHFVNELAVEFCSGYAERGTMPASLFLILSRMCYTFESDTISHMLNFTEKIFPMEGVSGITPLSQVCSDTKAVAQKLLNHYVNLQGLAISQMLRKSVETRDWMNTIEPRTVRAVMKRVVEDVTTIDSQVGQLYEEGTRRERSSDSSRKAFSYSTARQNPRSNWSSYAPSNLDDSLMSNIHKLFSERIEIFSAVEFSKVSILTGIIKISLKTLLECVRLRTFGRYGLQQIQVDIHYLQMYLWRFVSDENLVHVLLDEILGSTIHRCMEPILMETSVVTVICERG